MARAAYSISGIVEASVEPTWEALLAVVPELHVASTVPGIRTDVDPVRPVVSQQGEWWYRGVVSVGDRGDRSEITRAIYNVAPGWTSWLVPFVHRHDAHAFRAGHEALLRALAQRLGCGYVVTGS
jgi:hypothetical protein